MSETEILRVKAAVRERGGFRCADCGMSNDDHLAQFGRQLEVHRTVPGSEYTVEGCRPLCMPCHANKPRQRDSWGSLPAGVELADLMTVSEAATELGVSKSRVNQLLRTGRLRVAWTVAGRSLLRSDVATFAKLDRPAGRPKKK